MTWSPTVDVTKVTSETQHVEPGDLVDTIYTTERSLSFLPRACYVRAYACVLAYAPAESANPRNSITQSHHARPRFQHDCVLLNIIAIILHWRHPTTRQPDLDFPSSSRAPRLTNAAGAHRDAHVRCRAMRQRAVARHLGTRLRP